MGQGLGGFNGGGCFCLCVQGFDRVLGLAALEPAMLWVFGGNIRFCGCCRWRFRSYSGSLFQTPKSKQKAWPLRSAPGCGSAFLRSGIPPGASPTVCFAAPPLDVCGYAARRCAPAPDEHLRKACRWGRKSKARSKAGAKADQKIAAFGSSYRSKWGGGGAFWKDFCSHL